MTATTASTAPVGRFAPSPTGPLHYGSLLAAVGSYCLARSAGGRWLVRIEDLDVPRVVPGAADAILLTLDRLGLHWDGPIVRQSERGEAYAAALLSLQRAGLVFACACSRREIVASAPHQGEEGPVYPGTCRAGLPPGRPARALRLRVDAAVECFDDGVFGPVIQELATAVGDFVLQRADGLYAYQLAVVVDDAAAGVTQVVRGADLLASTPRQLYLYRSLGLSPPQYLHLPLVLGADGEKLSKRHGHALDLEGGQAIARVLTLLGAAPPRELDGAPPAELLAWGTAHIEPRRIPREPQPLPV